MSKLKAGVIGAGVFGAHHARKYQLDARVELVGVYDLDTERMEALAEMLGVRRFNNMDDMLDLLDIVTIASPPMTHASAAAAALEYHKHVLIEKPIAVSMIEAELLLQVAELNKRVLACGHQERLVFEAMGLFAAQEQPSLIESTRQGPWTGRSTDVSVALDLMVHDFDLAQTLAGAPPIAISAEGKAVHAASADAMTAEVRFDGLAARFTASRVAEARKRTMRIVYPSGEVNIDFLARAFSNTSKVTLNAGFAETAAGRDPLGANVTRFIDAVLGAASRPVVTGREAADALKIALDADKAAGLPSLSFT